MEEFEIYKTKSGKKIEEFNLQYGGKITEEKKHLDNRIDRLKNKIETLQKELKRLEEIKKNN